MAKTERFEMRWDKVTLDRVDDWRIAQADSPSRAAAIHRLVEHGLASVILRDGEKLILMMLCELYKHHTVMGELDPQFIAEAITKGKLWELRRQYPEIFSKEAQSEASSGH